MVSEPAPVASNVNANGDPGIAKRSELDPDWYTWQAVKRLIQSAGRIVRAPDDYGVTYCFDVNLGGLISRAGSQMPDYFKDAIRVLNRKQNKKKAKQKQKISKTKAKLKLITM